MFYLVVVSPVAGRFRTYKGYVYDFTPSPYQPMGLAGGLPIPLTATALLYDNLELNQVELIIDFASLPHHNTEVD